ncbi:axoneme-associated protein [Lasius niger]|uniref:Axoneme-associated protein n=1 Tax=Lasius niger TaxID=67767 RepID=A0A0J7JWI2_LASNI|nr:axoneme-associated protein [Lasius niger]
MEEWRDYFMSLLGGVESRVVKGTRKETGREDQEEKEINWEEIRSAIRRARDGKAMGRDEIPSEAWKYGGEEVERWIWEVCKRIWRGEGWPEQWKEGGIILILKKGEGGRVENYRGVTLMPSLYKIYMMVLADRLREEVESKGIIPKNQAGFRKKKWEQ